MSRHLGLDLGGTNIKVATVTSIDGGYELESASSVATEAADGPEAVTKNLVEVANGALDQHGEIATLGLGVPGHFERSSGRVLLFPNLPGEWHGYPLRDRVAEATGLATWMVNDARAFTLAEGMLGAGKGSKTIACITLGTGVGGGVMIDGKLHRGAFGVAGEIGHQTVVPDGPLCGCGNRGCVEALTKAEVLCSLAGKESASEVFDAARRGEKQSLEAVEQVADYLGLGLANVVAILGPDRIVVGGGISEAGELILGPIERAVQRRVTLVPTDQIEIVAAEFGLYAGAVGAALAGALRS